MTIAGSKAKSEPSAAPGRASFVAPRHTAGLAALLLVVAVFVAWSDGFSVPFVFDDGLAITDNPSVRHLWPLSDVLSPPTDNGSTVNGRPLVNLTLALNYAFGGTAVRGYHVVNLLIHALGALTLFGLVRRTLFTAPLRERCGADATRLALAVALLWAVHPLQTESVTYVVQRAESLAALFYLFTLYAFVRAVESTDARAGYPNRLWLVLSILACALGMVTKETVATAPLLALLYDRTFAAGTFRQAWRLRAKFYLGLATTWFLLAALVLLGGNRGGTAGFGVGVSSWDYALTQCRAIPHYISLSLWPSPLVFDYGMAVVHDAAAVAPQALLLSALLAATIVALFRRSLLGFAGACFFLILAPTSSVVPVTTQTMAEHRMYLPLAAIVAGAVLGLHALCGRRSFAVFSLCAVALACTTFQRNRDYRSELVLWADTVAKCPDNPRAQNNLGKALVEADRVPEALACFATALRLLPEYPETHNNLGYALAKTGRLAEAVAHYEIALRLRPDYLRAHDNLGNALTDLAQAPAAIKHFEAALRLKPDFADAHWGLGNALVQLHRLPEAIAHYERALRLDPNFAEAHCGLAVALSQAGRAVEANEHYLSALRLKPNYPEAHNNLGNALAKAGKIDDALVHYREALHERPGYVEARVNLANALLESGRPADSLPEYKLALAAKPDDPEAHYGVANACAQLDRLPEAVAAYRATLRLKPDHLAAHVNLGNVLLLLDRVPDAIAEYEIALRLNPNDATIRANLDQAGQLQRAGAATPP